MRGDIVHIDAARQLCFGFVAAEVSEDLETRFARAVGKACIPGGGCRAGASTLVEFAALGSTKLEAMGAPASARTGFSLGWRPPPEDWQRIEAGERSFDFAISEDGIQISLAGPATARKHFCAKEIQTMISGNVFTIRKDAPGYEVICKCRRAVQDGDLSGLTRDDFWRAIESAAKAYSGEARVTVEKATAMVLGTPLGRDLYSGYLAAGDAQAPPVSKAAARLSKRDEAWARIETAARERRKEAFATSGVPMTQEAAITAVCREQPDLYSDYIAAGGDAA